MKTRIVKLKKPDTCFPLFTTHILFEIIKCKNYVFLCFSDIRKKNIPTKKGNSYLLHSLS